MKRILLTYEQMMASVVLVSNLMEHFSETYECQLRCVKIAKMQKQDFEWADVIFAVRATDVFSEKLAKLARWCGKKYILNMDDNLLELPKDMIRFPRRRKKLKSILEATDVMLTPNRLLGERFVKISSLERFAQVNSAIRPEELTQVQHGKRQTVKIVFAAGGNHEEAFEQTIGKTLRTLAERYGKKLEWVFVCVHPDMHGYEKQFSVRYIPAMPLDKYRAFMDSEQFDIGLAPLLAGDFTQYKYFNKFVEYSISGVPGIYSDCAPNNLIVQDGVNGFLAENTTEGWERALCRVIDDVGARQQCIQNAQSQLCREFKEEYIIADLREKIPELTDYEAKSDRMVSGLKWCLMRMQYRLFRLQEIIYLTVMFAKKTGISGVKSRIMQHVKNKK